MARKDTLTGAYDALPWILKLIIVIIGGALVGGIYRIVKWTETKNNTTLIVGLLGTFTFVGNIIIWIVDVATTLLQGGITVFAD